MMDCVSVLRDALTTTAPRQKAARTQDAVAAWQAAPACLSPLAAAWPRPATREHPPLVPPAKLARRGLGSARGRAALLHAVAHIELNAIDLALDMAGRFTAAVPADNRHDFAADWLSVADDEARHFIIVADRLEELGVSYGDLPAHDGLWQAATRTEGDVLARLAIAPLVLEARGLDVTPSMIDGLGRNDDPQSAAILATIYRDEVGHVAIGAKWFRSLCTGRDLDPAATFAEMVGAHFPGGLKRPFNTDARDRSDFPRDWYEGIAVASR